jgi:hypothetical protein
MAQGELHGRVYQAMSPTRPRCWVKEGSSEREKDGGWCGGGQFCEWPWSLPMPTSLEQCSD